MISALGAAELIGETPQKPSKPDADRSITNEEMNEEIHDQLEEYRGVLNGLKRVVPLLWFLLVGAFALGGWVTTLQVATNSNARETMSNSSAVRELALWKERTEANRFTQQDGVRISDTIAQINSTQNQILNAQDKRLQRTEDAIAAIEKTLAKLESRLP